MSTETVREQYERYPYPPVPRLAWPEADQGDTLAWERGRRRCGLEAGTHEGIRILIAGCGTLEPLVVGQNHPRAATITAVDLSTSSLEIARSKYRWLRHLRWASSLGRHGLPTTDWVTADLLDWEPGAPGFDFIIASNVLHHVSDPGVLFKRLDGWLKPDGMMRVVTYPRQSRIWMRETGRWLRLRGVEPGQKNLCIATQRAMNELPVDHPLRANYEIHPEVGTDTGLVDAFLHACENPLFPHEWFKTAQAAGLELGFEDQQRDSRSDFLDEWLPEFRDRSPWIKLQILDDLLELCSNPVLWFRHARGNTHPPVFPEFPATRPAGDMVRPASEISAVTLSRVYPELKEGLLRVRALLEGSGVTLEELEIRMKLAIAPRIRSQHDRREVKGLSLVDYSWKEILASP